MDLKQFLRAVRRGWWAVALFTVVGLAAGVGITATQSAKYSSTVKWYVSAPPGVGNTNLFNNIQYAQQLVNSYVKVLSTDSVGAAVVQTSGVPKTAKQVAKEISGSSPLNTQILAATITDSSAVNVTKLSAALAQTFGPYAAGLDSGTKNAGSVSLTKIQGPTEAVKVGPRRTLNYALGLFLGLIIGLAAAALRELLNSSVRSAQELETLAGKPTLGALSLNHDAKKQPLIVGKQAHSPFAEEFRQLRTGLQFVDVDRPPSIIAVTSSLAGEGKSIVSVNLALSFAETGANVLLIEADLRKPRVCSYLGLDGSIGLTNVLAGQLPVADVVQRWGQSSVSVLAGGVVPPNPAEILGSRQMRDLLTSLRSQFDLIIIDTPPVLPVTDAAVVSTFADGVVFVVRYGKTTPAQVSSAVKSIQAVDSRLLGFILNMRPVPRSERKQYGGYHDYEEISPPPSSGGSEVKVSPDKATVQQFEAPGPSKAHGMSMHRFWPRRAAG